MKKILLTLLATSLFSGISKGSLPDCLEDSINNYSLVLFTLNKNMVRIEQYDLDDLKQEVNYISNDKSNSHCVYRLALGERGLKVSSVLLNANELKKMMVLTQRGRKDIWYILHWAKLMAKHQYDVQEFMRAYSELLDVSISTGAKPHWISKIQITWGYDVNKIALYIELERKVEAVAAVIVPTCILQTPASMFQLLTREQLLEMGILTVADAHTRTVSQERPGCGSCSLESSSCAADLPEEESYVESSDDVAVQSQVKPTWYSALYQGVIGKLAAVQRYMCDKIKFLC